MQQHPEDKLVIQTVLQGRQDAFAILVDRYRAYVFTLVMRYIDDRSVAEELAQDVFVKAYRYLADYKGTGKFGTWLYTIVNTTCYTYLRKNKIRIVLHEEDRIELLSDEYQAAENGEHILEIKNRNQTLTHAISILPAEDARIITLFYMAEQSVEEIAKILGITTSNVKVKLFRARQKLRETIETKFKNDLI